MIDDITPANLRIRNDDNLVVETLESRGENLDFFDNPLAPPASMNSPSLKGLKTIISAPAAKFEREP